MNQKNTPSDTTPVILPVTPYHRVVNIQCIAILALLVLYLWSVWEQLPPEIPVHFNAAGVADGWGDKRMIWMLPGIAAIIYLLISLVERYPRFWNTGVKITPENRDRVYAELKNLLVTIKLVVVIAFSYIAWAAVSDQAMGIWFLPVFLAFVFVPMIYFFIRAFRASRS